MRIDPSFYRALEDRFRGDTDTLGAVTGALAGARFGASGLPDRWLETVEYREDLELLGQALASSQLRG